MTSKATLAKDVAELTRIVNPAPQHFIIEFSFGSLSDPHGFLGGNLLHMVTSRGIETRWLESIDSETELRKHKAYYDDMISKRHNKFMKVPDHVWSSWEKFYESNRCRCGQHGEDGQQPFTGTVEKKTVGVF